MAALFYSLPLLEVVVDADGSGCTRYKRHFGVGEIECWVVSAFCGPEAELDRFGSAPVTADFDVIEEMARRLGLTWTPNHLDRFRQRARSLVWEERRSIRVVADALCDRRHMTSDEIGVLLSAVTTPRSLWVA